MSRQFSQVMKVVKAVTNLHRESGFHDPDVHVGALYDVVERIVPSIAGDYLVVRAQGSRGPDMEKPRYFFEAYPSASLGNHEESAPIWIDSGDYVKLLRDLDRLLTTIAENKCPDPIRMRIAAIASRICSLHKEEPCSL